MKNRATNLRPTMTENLKQIFIKAAISCTFLMASASVHSEVLKISLQQNHFEPTEKDLTLTDIFPGTVVFSESKPQGIHFEPTYEGLNQRYAIVNLGNKSDQRFYVVLDYIDERLPVCYFDTNKNGNIADDDGPTETDLDYFSIFNIEIPCSTMFDGVDWRGDIKIHLSASPENSTKGIFTLSVSTVLEGKVNIEGATYNAYIADSRQNDADFTNDGIVIDLNNDGAIDRKTELFPPNSPVRVNSKDYDLEVIWGSNTPVPVGKRPRLPDPQEKVFAEIIHIPIILRPLVFLFRLIF